VVVALGGAPVELVVATDVSLNFLQVTTDPMFVFRVFEKIVLRIQGARCDRGARRQLALAGARGAIEPPSMPTRVVVLGGGWRA
jgi:hypothetical protein